MALSLFLVLASSLLGVSGQLLLKMGMERMGALDLSSLTAVLRTAIQVFTMPWVLLGLGCYGVSAMIWLVVLSRLDVSLAYPLVALNFVLVPLFAWLLLGEQVPSWRWVGIGCVLLGVTIVSST
jgi:drug/metabolite transporter (DMT)-like permease